ncbi:VanZ like family protein [Polaribacter sp. Hel1_33_78]|jgi:VanZ family protein|uniref:VanZ family protein n=1 Tax=Polaribacter sp. Hel1_33_78 TaxID=1336804 RepID=UPI00087A5191|nr:VanZ family protein [Polaribacter sp. Hel1_33_78]SDT91662.1 VanZ like family protein [Polaribacter sp. Hel1_33_78]
MLKNIKTLLRNNSFIIAFVTTIIIVCLSLIRVPNAPIKLTFTNIDKIFHGFAYFMLALSWLIAYYKKPNKKYWIVILCIVFGIIIELLQSKITLYRSGDYLDVIANSAGALSALLIFNIISKKK